MIMHRYTSAAGWVVSAANGVASAALVPVSGTSMVSTILTVVSGAVGAVLARVLWDATGSLTTRLHLRPRPIDCPLAGSCPIVHPPRASSHDLEAATRQTIPDRDNS